VLGYLVRRLLWAMVLFVAVTVVTYAWIDPRIRLT
jgi:hypothetical protein